MLDIHGSLASLAKQRPVFHSEADFQHALAWQLHRDHPAALLRLEYPSEYPSGSDSRIYLDILFRLGEERVALELKYKTLGLHMSIGEEIFDLKSQRAQDVGRYDFLRDIQRLETLTSGEEVDHGYAILLSNDHGYWRQSSSYTVDAAFRLHEGSLVKGLRHWGPKASPGTTSGREDPIDLRGNYRNRWRDFAQVTEEIGGQFRYLLHEIRAD